MHTVFSSMAWPGTSARPLEVPTIGLLDKTTTQKYVYIYIYTIYVGETIVLYRYSAIYMYYTMFLYC